MATSAIMALAFSALDASAASFVTLSPPSATISRSMIVLGEPSPSPERPEQAPQSASHSDEAEPVAEIAEEPIVIELPPIHVISRSVIAMGVPAPTPEPEVAVVSVQPKRPIETPMVIRGGLVGAAFPMRDMPAAASAPAEPVASDASQPAPPRTPRRQPREEPVEATRPPAPAIPEPQTLLPQ